MDRTILVLEKQTELRQDDIRQETNNIINKFNGNIEWWIFLLGIICGVAPILLTFLNHQKDAEYIELLNDNFEKMAAQMKDKEDALREKEEELDKVKRTLLKADMERQLDWEERFNPKAVAEFSEENGYYASGYGSSWTLISEGAGKLGLTAKELPLVKGKMVDAVENGHPVILALGKGDFTSSGHYIVLTGWENGAFRVNDPNSRLRSQKLWTYEELEGQIRNIWEIS